MNLSLTSIIAHVSSAMVFAIIVNLVSKQQNSSTIDMTIEIAKSNTNLTF